jgi:hypothetical protein
MRVFMRISLRVVYGGDDERYEKVRVRWEIAGMGSCPYQAHILLGHRRHRVIESRDG